VLDSAAEEPGFKSQPLRQTVHIHRACVHQAAKLGAALLRVARVTAGLAESNGSLPPVYDSRHLQADCQEPGSAPDHTLDSRVWATFIFIYIYIYIYSICRDIICEHDVINIQHAHYGLVGPDCKK